MQAVQHGIPSTLDDPRYLAAEQRVAELNSQMQQGLQVNQQAHTKDVLQFEERQGSDATALGGGTAVSVQAPSTVHEASKVAGVALATSHEAPLANVLACYCPCGKGSTMTVESAAVKQAEALFVQAASVSTEVRLRSPSLAADASVVGDMSEDHTAVGAEVETETGPGTVDMKEMEAIAEALMISITRHSANVWELQELPLSTLSNQDSSAVGFCRHQIGAIVAIC